MNTLEALDTYENFYLKVNFRYYATGLVAVSNMRSINVIDTLRLYPSNYPQFDFEMEKSSSVRQTSNGWQTDFYLPIKTINECSLYTVASMDVTYPRTAENTVPLRFAFDLDENTVKPELFATGALCYVVTFSVAGSFK